MLSVPPSTEDICYVAVAVEVETDADMSRTGGNAVPAWSGKPSGASGWNRGETLTRSGPPNKLRRREHQRPIRLAVINSHALDARLRIHQVVHAGDTDRDRKEPCAHYSKK